MSENYKIGFGKPPANHQFKKGKSGNPKGRPRKQSILVTFGDAYKDALTNRHRVKTRNGYRYMQAIEIAVHAIVRRAMTGETKAMDRVLQDTNQLRIFDNPLALRDNIAKQKMLEEFEKEADEWLANVGRIDKPARDQL